MVDEQLYQQEINELTDLLRSDETWADLRKIVLEQGFTPSETFLVSFFEDEEEQEYGVLVTKDKRVFEYSRSTAEGQNDSGHFKVTDITNNEEKADEYPQIEVALKMIND